MDAPHTEIDALYHGPGWVPRDEFLDDVRRLVAAESWTTEWQYATARTLLTEAADLVVWLDLPFASVTLPRVVRRTVSRRLKREVLWNGNVEPPFHTIFTDREHIVRWAYFTRNKYQARIPAIEATHPDLTVVRLKSPRQVESWLTGPLTNAAR